MPVHEDITAAWAQARPILADAFHPDAYQLKRETRASDDSGGWTTTTTTVETGTCSLEPNRLVTEGASGVTTISVSGYVVEFSNIETVVRPTDVLHIDGRVFDINGVMRGGDHSLFVTAQVEERL